LAFGAFCGFLVLDTVFIFPFSSLLLKLKLRLLPVALLFLVGNTFAAYNVTKKEDLWSLKPLARPELPKNSNASRNPVDLFLAEEQAANGVVPLGGADKLTWLRRVTLI
jgi:hypothetical protein